MNLIEGALYVTGKPLDIKTISSITKVRSEKHLFNLLSLLIKKYEELDGPIQILKLQDRRYVMQLKPEYGNKVKRLIDRPLLRRGPLKTLSFIAFKQPVAQSYVAKVRGSMAYNHIKLLKENGLIETEKIGRNRVLKTTTNFSDYFNLSRDTRIMKTQLRKIFDESSSSN
jgi:segregation and condensation protein B